MLIPVLLLALQSSLHGSLKFTSFPVSIAYGVPFRIQITNATEFHQKFILRFLGESKDHAIVVAKRKILKRPSAEVIIMRPHESRWLVVNGLRDIPSHEKIIRYYLTATSAQGMKYGASFGWSPSFVLRR